MKPKAQTLQQKMGFFDEDLVKPKHDELMLWLDSNIENIINELFNKPYDDSFLLDFKKVCDKKISEIIATFSNQINNCQDVIDGKSKKRYQENIAEMQSTINRLIPKVEYLKNLNLFEKIPEKPRIKTIKKTWELPVMSQISSMSNKYTVGFIDFATSFNVPTIFLDGLKYKSSGIDTQQIFDDIEETLRFGFYALRKSIYIEVKTEIKSIGELIRQINHYRTYLPGDYYVLCPNDESRKTLEDQNIGFINYK